MAVPAFLARERIIARPGFNRWLIPPAALAVHLCIGQAYATSVYKTALVEHFDASLTSIGIIFSIAIVMLGLSAAVFGKWVDRNGPRAAMATSAVFWVTGFLVGSLGIATEQLWLLYLGYGVIGGIGLGIGYISPVSTLIKWFPDRPGLATGIAIMGFGGGALIASPLTNQLLSVFGGSGANPDVNGIAETFLVMGLIYAVFMSVGWLLIRVPAPDWKPAGWDPAHAKTGTLITTANVSARNAIRTPQFWLLWVVLCFNVTAGIGILERAAPIYSDFFPDPTSPQALAAAAAGFVAMLSLANSVGRILWSSTSDFLGRKNMYRIYLGVGALLYLGLTLLTNTNKVLFLLISMLLLSFYGGGFATVPAYLRDLFGTYQVGAIHGRLLTAWSTAGVLGPVIVNAIADARIAAGVAGPGRYTLSFTIMVGLLVVGFVCNELIRPVSERYHEPAQEQPGTRTEARA